MKRQKWHKGKYKHKEVLNKHPHIAVKKINYEE